MRFLRTTNIAQVARLTAVWGVIFAVVHAYWAAGGEAGVDGDPADTLAAQSYIAFIAVLGLAGTAVARSLAHGSRRRVFILLARAGGAALLLGVVFGTGSWLANWSLDGDGAAGVVTTLYFLLGGLLFSTLGWRQDTARLPQPGRAGPPMTWPPISRPVDVAVAPGRRRSTTAPHGKPSVP
jgi:hypothetical protein